MNMLLLLLILTIIFREAIEAGPLYKENSIDFMDQVMWELEVSFWRYQSRIEWV